MNLKIFQFFNNLANQSFWTDKLIIFIASILPYILILSAAIFLFWHSDAVKRSDLKGAQGPTLWRLEWQVLKKKAKEIFFVFLVAFLAWGIGFLLKNMIQSLRPYAILDGVHKLVSPNDNFAFPSGHATFFAGLGVSLFLRHKKVGLIFLVGALLIGLARIVVGVHFPVDILGGFLLGAGVALLVDSFFKKS